TILPPPGRNLRVYKGVFSLVSRGVQSGANVITAYSDWNGFQLPFGNGGNSWGRICATPARNLSYSSFPNGMSSTRLYGLTRSTTCDTSHHSPGVPPARSTTNCACDTHCVTNSFQ